MDVGIRKPAILSLHGGGTSAAIYKIQTLRLRRVLGSHFDFVFVNAPFVTPAGPGVLPFFEGAGPFYSWERPSDGGRIRRESIMVAEEAMKKRYTETGQPFVAVMGFSQGAKLGATIMLAQQARQKYRRFPWDGFKYGIFLMGTCPTNEDFERISAPTVHLIGSLDVYGTQSKRLWEEYCEEDAATLVELPLGHQIPVLTEHTNELVLQILRVHDHFLGNRT